MLACAYNPETSEVRIGRLGVQRLHGLLKGGRGGEEMKLDRKVRIDLCLQGVKGRSGGI